MKVFLSYSSNDRATAAALAAALKGARPGFDVYFDQQKVSGGVFWMPELHREVENADAFVFLFGTKLGPWQALEYYGAFERRVKSPDLPIAPVLAGDAQLPGLPFFNQLHWIAGGADPAAPAMVARIVAALERKSDAAPPELLRLVNPYRGLQSLREQDAALLFGRDALLGQMLDRLAGDSRKAMIAVGNSGVGKSSLMYAGVFSALARQSWNAARTWPAGLGDSRAWLRLTFKPGERPLRELARAFVGQWRDAKQPEFHRDIEAWTARLGEASHPLDELIHAADNWAQEQDSPTPARYVLYVDQAEELYTRADKASAERLSRVLAQAAQHDRIRILMSLRSDFYGKLQDDAALWTASEKIDVPRLDEAGFHDVVTGPAQTLGAAFEQGLAGRLVEAAVAQPVGLPLLSYQLTETWGEMIARGDGTLRWPRPANTGFDLARALVDRADGYLRADPAREDTVRRLFCVRLVHVPDQGAPSRRVALQEELSAEEQRVAQDLAGQDYRLLAAGETDDGRPNVEVGHEALLTAWERLRNWIADRRSFYAWRTRLENERKDWETAGRPRTGLLMGRTLEIARAHLAMFAADVPKAEADFVALSEANDVRTARAWLSLQAIMLFSLVMTIIGLVAWINQESLERQWYRFWHFQGHDLTPERLAALNRGEQFLECDDAGRCPLMTVLPAGEFKMGSPEGVGDEDERPQRVVRVAAFAVSKYEITFGQWAACVAGGGCKTHPRPGDGAWGRGNRPITDVSWEEAKEYVAWLSAMTGSHYRLLSEAEWEYAARGVTTTDARHTRWGFGDDETKVGDFAWFQRNSSDRTQPVGQKSANAFGLHDMHGNVSEWVEDCYVFHYDFSVTDARAATLSPCTRRIFRGGGWTNIARDLRSAKRSWINGSARFIDTGFRVARTLSSP